MKVGGRLSKGSMLEEAKHPLILSKEQHVSMLILKHVHQSFGHGGRIHTLSSVRRRFWITSDSSAVRNVIAECSLCRDYNGRQLNKRWRIFLKKRQKRTSGTPEVLRSDNGSNFIGADRKLKEALANLNQEEIQGVLSQAGIRWSFYPPAGSHHGGVWEWMIRLVRKVLSTVLHQQRPGDDGLHTVFFEVKAILND